MATNATRPSEPSATARRSLRRRLIAIVGLTSAAIVVGLAARALTLHGLPDQGDPFDVAEFTSHRVADADNAFRIYLPAVAELRKGNKPFLWTNAGWGTLTEAERAQFEPLRPALDLWRKGTEKPDAAYIPIADRGWTDSYDPACNVGRFGTLACLEASRLEGQGDFAGAWAWYRAALRSSRHIARNAAGIERSESARSFLKVSRRIRAWASQDGVGPGLLRLALDDLIAADRLTPKASDLVKLNHLMTARAAESSRATLDLVRDLILLETTSPRWRRARSALLPLEWIARREPERSRRVSQRVTASWLAQIDRPPAERPAFAGAQRLTFASAGPDAATEAGYESTLLFKALWPGTRSEFDLIDRERAEFATLVIALASELHRRERGAPPASDEALVGTYLKALPDGYHPVEPVGK